VHQQNVDRAAASVGLHLTPGQRDALTSFDFNTGDAEKLITTSGGNIAEIMLRLPTWNKVTEGGRKVLSPGLVNRRRKEMEMFKWRCFAAGPAPFHRYGNKHAAWQQVARGRRIKT
jgi:GH24 family phage-related lysozyme (muramidase)